MKTQQLPRITKPGNTIALGIKITAILFTTLVIFARFSIRFQSKHL